MSDKSKQLVRRQQQATGIRYTTALRIIEEKRVAGEDIRAFVDRVETWSDAERKAFAALHGGGSTETQ